MTLKSHRETCPWADECFPQKPTSAFGAFLEAFNAASKESKTLEPNTQVLITPEQYSELDIFLMEAVRDKKSINLKGLVSFDPSSHTFKITSSIIERF